MRGGAELTDDLPQNERFGLFWPGKTAAIRAAQTPTTATLTPDFDESLDWDTTQNVFIEGDNLEVLKILQKHYYGKIKMIYIDPACGSGSLLLKFAKVLGTDNVGGFYGQEINLTTYNLARINMFLHDVAYDKFDIALGDTLIEPAHWGIEPFEAIVSKKTMKLFARENSVCGYVLVA